jgi:alanyl-tRNA synthetase
MLGNFSFGDYFKREAIAYAWEFVTSKEFLGIPAERLRATVLHSDDESRRLWGELTSLPASVRVRPLREGQFLANGRHRSLRALLGDLRRPRMGPGTPPQVFSQVEFEEMAESGRFLEIWNLVFHAIRSGRGRHPNPAPQAVRGHRRGSGSESPR